MTAYIEHVSIFGMPDLPSAAELEWLESNRDIESQGVDEVNRLRHALYQHTLGELP